LIRGTSEELDVVVTPAVVVVTSVVDVTAAVSVVVAPDDVVVLPPVVGELESPQAASARARTIETGRSRRIHRG
jgi:hypothetical protein